MRIYVLKEKQIIKNKEEEEKKKSWIYIKRTPWNRPQFQLLENRQYSKCSQSVPVMLFSNTILPSAGYFKKGTEQRLKSNNMWS